MKFIIHRSGVCQPVWTLSIPGKITAKELRENEFAERNIKISEGHSKFRKKSRPVPQKYRNKLVVQFCSRLV